MKHPVVHFEIMGHNAPALRQFYAGVFGWRVAAQTPGAGGVDYTIVEPVPNFAHGINGGIGAAPPGYGGHLTFYVVVDDIESALAKIEAHGGSRMMGPEKVANGPVIALFTDPEGHTVGLVDPGGDMRGAPMDLEPMVFFYGRCAEALEFYKAALGGSYEVRLRDGDRIDYARFTGPGIAFGAADGTGERIDPEAGNISLSLAVPDASRAAEIFDALAKGGKVLQPFGDAQWGGKFGNVYDRFGNEWFVTSAQLD